MNEFTPLSINGKPVGEAGLPAIITPLVGKTQAELLDEVAAIVPKKPDLLEWRIDFFAAIGDSAAVIAAALAIRAAAGGIPVLLTRRSSNEGGQPLAIDETAVIAMYKAACAARCVELIDYELSNAPAALAELRAVSAANGVALIVSYHNFQMTPAAEVLVAKFTAAAAVGADVAKVAVMPQDADDVLRLLAATRSASQAVAIPLISMAMGGVGSVSRIMGWLYGSAATFAVGKSSSAPGQIAIDSLRAALLTLRRSVSGA